MTSVQAVAESGITEVPPQYVQPHNTRSHKPNSPPSTTIPLIDLSTPSHKEAIAKACKDLGAFHVINHGVPHELLRQVISLGISFFQNYPLEEKLQYACDPNLGFASEGYGSKMLVQNDTAFGVLDWRDYFDHHTLPLSRRDPSRWPHFPPCYREVISKYSDQMKVLAQKLLSTISESLGLPPTCIEETVGEFYQNITISYYPPCPQPDLTLGLQSHSDMGAITLLIQDDVPGLQVCKDSDWIIVPPMPESILVLLADQIEVITNGKYRSAVHRVLTNNNRARLSIATFHDPDKVVKISPAQGLLSESSSQKFREVKYGDYISSWYTKGPEGKRNLDALRMNC